MRTVVVFTGGDPVDPALDERLPADAFVIAADSGVEHAAAVGRRVHLAVGDFDSVDPAVLATVEEAGATIERHPEAKDATDLEIGLVAALEAGAERIIVVGGHGGRLDHFLANALLLAAPGFADVTVEALVGPARLTAIHHGATLSGQRGELVSLLPLGGPATGVRTTGLLYSLDDEDLHPGTTRGVSNEFLESEAVVTVRSGTLLAVQPGVPGTHVAAGIGLVPADDE